MNSRQLATPEIRLKVLNLTRGTVLATSLEVADSGPKRNKGLLGRKGLAPGEGLWIIPCESVHTFFMQFPIDLVYLDRQNRIKKIRDSVRPWRLSVWRHPRHPDTCRRHAGIRSFGHAPSLTPDSRAYSGTREGVPRKHARRVAFSSRKSHLENIRKGTVTLVPLLVRANRLLAGPHSARRCQCKQIPRKPRRRSPKIERRG